jgi:hypothetical protein
MESSPLKTTLEHPTSNQSDAAKAAGHFGALSISDTSLPSSIALLLLGLCYRMGQYHEEMIYHAVMIAN